MVERMAIDRETDQKIMFFQKSTPFFIDHGPVRLNRIMDLYLLLLLIH
ncbi:hypothetical protein RV03_GL000532 [Enterococcus gallinarum]|nr:hypothetical protein RV03_GL000532 [Enterococcus gallinarum]